MPVKYAVYPGFVQSQRDGDRHWVSARELMRLYGVDPKECVVMEGPRKMGLRVRSLIRLHPRPLGDYALPEAG